MNNRNSKEWADELAAVMAKLCNLKSDLEEGKLISTDETGDNELEFFSEHNETVRKVAIFTFLDTLFAGDYLRDGKTITKGKLLEVANEVFGIKYFDISKPVKLKFEDDPVNLVSQTMQDCVVEYPDGTLKVVPIGGVIQ